MTTKLRVSINDAADRYTILQLKWLHGIECSKELAQYRRAVKPVDGTLLKQLYDVNKAMWDTELLAEKETDMRKMGELYTRQRYLNKQRVGLKNEIAHLYEGIIEEKKYI